MWNPCSWGAMSNWKGRNNSSYDRAMQCNGSTELCNYSSQWNNFCKRVREGKNIIEWRWVTIREKQVKGKISHTQNIKMKGKEI